MDKMENIIEVQGVDVVESEITDLVMEEETALDVQREIVNTKRLMEMADFLSKSTIVPTMYQHRPENCYIALDMSIRMGLSPMVVMQNLFVIQGKPSWSGQALASLIRNSNQFTDVELNFVGKEGTDDWGAYITAKRKSSGKDLKGATVTIKMAKSEGWYQKGGSKWQTIPELMLSYRAYAFFQRVYAPELSMGLQSMEEVEDISQAEVAPKVVNPYKKGE